MTVEVYRTDFFPPKNPCAWGLKETQKIMAKQGQVKTSQDSLLCTSGVVCQHTGKAFSSLSTAVSEWRARLARDTGTTEEWVTGRFKAAVVRDPVGEYNLF